MLKMEFELRDDSEIIPSLPDNFKLHSQLSLFPHLVQLQSHSNNEALHPTHLVYSAKSSLIEMTYKIIKNKCKINILEICSLFSIIMIHLFIFYTINNKHIYMKIHYGL